MSSTLNDATVDYAKNFDSVLSDLRLPGRFAPSARFGQGSRETEILVGARGYMRDTIARNLAIPTGAMPHVELDFCDSAELNAFAQFRDGAGYIVVCWGAVLILADFFYRMLAHPQVLVNIGDPRRERIEDFHPTRTHVDYNELTRSRSTICMPIDVVMPKCVDRRRYAEVLLSLALRFLALHELGHIRHGHCQWISATHGLPLIQEFRFAGGQIKSLTWQALEMDTDAYATLASLMMLEKTHPDQFKYRAAIDTGAKGMGESEIIRLFRFDWCLALTALFWLFGLEFDHDRLSDSKYFPAPTRAMNVAELAIRRLAGDDSKVFERSHMQAWATVAVTFMHLDPRVDRARVNAALDGHFDERLVLHFGAVKREWTRIRPVLLPFSFTQQLAP